MAAASSTSPNSETVSLKLPSGELVDAVVPAGMSDEQVGMLMKSKRPDLMVPDPKKSVQMQSTEPTDQQRGQVNQNMGRIAQGYASALPLMLGGGISKPTPMPTTAAPGLSKIPLGPDAPPNEIMQSRPLGQPPAADPAAGLGEIPVAQGERLKAGLARIQDYPVSAPEPRPQVRALPHGQYAAAASPLPPQKTLGEGVYEGEYMEEPPPAPPTVRGALPRGQYAARASSLPSPRQLGGGSPRPVEATPQIQTTIERQPTVYPPEEPTSPYRIVAPRSRAELLDDQGVQERMRNYLDKQDRAVHAFEPIGGSKGAINEEFNQKIGKPSPPVKYTKTPGVRSSSQIQNSVEATPANADLEKLLRDSVEQAKKKKGQ